MIHGVSRESPRDTYATRICARMRPSTRPVHEVQQRVGMRGPRERTPAPAALVALAALAALVACGEDSSSESPLDPTENDAGSGTSSSGSSGGATTPGGATLDCGGHGCGVKQMALGNIAACALLEDATVACYGGGIVGTLGRDDRPDVDPVPTRVPNLRDVARVFGGGYTMCALHTDKTVSCWGPDQSVNPYGARPGSLFEVDGLADVTDVAVATSHTCALTSGGDVYCFGSNYFGELGDGTTDNSKRAVKVKGISGAKAIATGGEVSCAVLADGNVACWGTNELGQLGQTPADKLVHEAPANVPGLGGPAKAVAASSASGAVCALLESGATTCWGEKPTPDTGATGAVALSVGWKHACALDAGGAVSCWGANTKGQLGNASTAPSSATASVSGAGGASSLAVGGDSSCAVFADGAFACWGDDSRGQLGGGAIGKSRPEPRRTHF